MAKASNNQFPSVLFTASTAPASPAAGDLRAYVSDQDHHFKTINSTGAIVDLQQYAMAQAATINVVIDGGGSAITTGVKCDVEIPWACTFSRVTALGDQVGSIVIDIWKSTYAAFPPVNTGSITGTSAPTLTSTKRYQDAAIASWVTTAGAGSILRYNVDSASTTERVTVSLLATRTA